MVQHSLHYTKGNQRCYALRQWLATPEKWDSGIISKRNMLWLGKFKDFEQCYEYLKIELDVIKKVLIYLAEQHERDKEISNEIWLTYSRLKTIRNSVFKQLSFIRSVKYNIKNFSIDNKDIISLLVEAEKQLMERADRLSKLLRSEYITMTPIEGFINYLDDNNLDLYNSFDDILKSKFEYDYDKYISYVLDLGKEYNYLEEIYKRLEHKVIARRGRGKFSADIVAKHNRYRDEYLYNLKVKADSIEMAVNSANVDSHISKMAFRSIVTQIEDNNEDIFIVLVAPTSSSNYKGRVYYLSNLDGAYVKSLYNAYCAKNEEELNTMVANYLKNDLLGLYQIVRVVK